MIETFAIACVVMSVAFSFWQRRVCCTLAAKLRWAERETQRAHAATDAMFARVCVAERRTDS
jgi:hypothetical protein